MTRKLALIMAFFFLAALSTSLMAVLAAANTVPVSGYSNQIYPLLANQLKPPQCAEMNLTNIVVGGMKIDGTSGNDLILGGPGHNEIHGGDGNDCILSGGGSDKLSGDAGNDVLIGGSGNDQFDGGDGSDVCYGWGGNDKFDPSCETQIP
jgi:Ca2+-binding RTX toxin-like protein